MNLLMEALIVILILAVAFTAFMGVMAQAVRVSSRSSQVAEAVLRYEPLIFEVESGLRPDLAAYGGGETLDDEYRYEIKAEKEGELSSVLKSRLSWKEGRESLDLELVVLEAPTE